MIQSETFRLSKVMLVIATLCWFAAVQADTWMTRIADLEVGYHEGGVVLTADGGHAIAGGFYSDENISYPRVAKFAANGELEWSKDYSAGRVAAFDAVGEGGFLLIAENDPFGSVRALRLDDSGNIMNEANIGAPMNFAKVIGNSAYLVTDGVGLAIAKLNLDTLAVEWNKLVSYEAPDIWVRSVEEGRNGALLVVGWVSQSDNLDGFILEMSDQGVLRSYHVVGRPGLTDKVRDVAVMADGSLVLAGDAENVDTGSRYDVWTVKLNPDWSIDWQKQFEGPGTEWCNSVAVLADNTILVGATARTWSPNGEYDFWGIRIKDKKSGPVVKWQKRYWTVDRDEAYDIVATADGGFILVGQHYVFPGTQGSLMVKADVKGNVYAVNNAEEIIDCPCETRTKSPVIDTNATISDQMASVVISDYEITVSYAESSPVELNLPFERICN